MLGHVPDDADSLTFKALQTYSNGDVVRWIDAQQAGQPAARPSGAGAHAEARHEAVPTSASSAPSSQ